MKIFITDKYRIITFLIICTLIFASALFCCTAVPVSAPQKKLLPIYSVEREDKALCITFDCASGADDIDKIISVLEKNNCPAAFFVLGTWAQNNPDAVKKLVAAGHEIGNHSWNHTLYTTLSSEKIKEDISKCDDAVSKITGNVPHLFRAPSGDYNNAVVQAAETARKIYLQWSLDSLDWKGLTAAEMKARIVPNAKNGDIILFHNGTPHTAEALDEILSELRKNGFSFVKASDFVYRENFYLDHTGRQIKQ